MLALFAATNAYAIFIIKMVLCAIILVCSGFMIVVVMIQKSNSDGTSALGGSGSSDNDSFYGKNKSQRKEHQLKIWTFIAAGLLAICSIVVVILSNIGA
ncbi:MAG: preprotein translocase subunit SecG [Clostridia bacterium]